MRLLIFLAVIVIVPLFTAAQSAPAKKKVEKKPDQSDNLVFVRVENDAHPDQKQWNAYIHSKLALPPNLADTIPKGTYPVKIKFIVDKHGYIGQISAAEDPGYGIGNYAVQVIRNFPGTWTPASQCGRNVNSYRTQMLSFVVE
jgi:periplasmic protein TonB